MGRTTEKLGALTIAVVVVAALMAIAFGIGYLVGKILL
jgi:hypothetical protein